MRWSEDRLADYLKRRGVPGAANTVDVSEPPFALPAEQKPSKWSQDREIPHVCKLCSATFVSKVPRHLYCEPCSESQDLKRKKTHIRRTNAARRKDEKRAKGLEISKKTTGRSLADPPHQPEINWKVSITVPFAWTGSKNAIWAMRSKGHVALRRESAAYRDAIIAALRPALRGITIRQNKLWLDIFVEKNNHKGDAVNFVDLVCDAVKVATDLDDRWFCIRNLDWSIVKHEPNLMISISQEDVEDVQPCSYCGRLLTFEMFSKNKANKSGIARVCRDCGRKGHDTTRPCL